MTAAIKILTYDPEWEPPDDDELQEVSVDKAFMAKVEMFHTGLKSLSFKGVWKNEDGAVVTQPVSSFKIRGGGTNKIPGIKKEVLAQLITARAIEHAEEVGEIVNYKVTFYGDNEDLGGAFQKQGSFKVDGRPDEDEEEEEEEEEEDKGQSTAIHRGPEVRVLPNAAGPAMVRPGAQESEAVQMFKVLQQWSAGLFAELRVSMTQQRIDMTASMQAQREDYRHILGDMGALMTEVRADLQHSRDEVNKANQRIVKMSDQQSSHFSGQQEANKQGWEAFRAGMQMQLQAMSQSMSWERQVMFMQFDQLAQTKRKEERPKWVKDYGPLIIAAVGQVMTSKGSPMGEAIQELAMSAMDDDDEDDNEDGGETPTATPPRPGGPVMGVPDGTDPKEHFEKNKLSSMLQLLNSMLTDEQHKKLKTLLPEMGYATLQTALRSTNDSLAKAYVIQFIAHVQQIEGLDDKLTAELTDEQRDLFNDIGLIVTQSMPGKKKKRPPIDVEAAPSPPKSAPPPPPAPPAPPPPPPAPKASGEDPIPDFDPEWRIAKLKAYAKKHYSLEAWPKGTKKKDIISAIKKAAKARK